MRKLSGWRCLFEKWRTEGIQVSVLTPGIYRINTDLFSVDIQKATVVPGGHICLVTAMDGNQIPDGRLLADKVEGIPTLKKERCLLQRTDRKVVRFSI